MPVELIECANCGARIGKLETPHVFNDQIVCGVCLAKLDREPPADLIPAEVSRPIVESSAQVAARMGGKLGPRPVVHRSASSSPSSAGLLLQLAGGVAAIAGGTVWILDALDKMDLGPGVTRACKITSLVGALVFGLGRFLTSQEKK